eukprot:GHVR01189284.1.p1 GENE.GHVR01189284.1~~GHVR01189284.1.p1  ORF type:complete len:439 (+),score=99.61 GHVR01189284.1:35-1351(+)
MDKLGVVPWLVTACTNMNITIPTDIQLKSIPYILKGSDVVAKAHTGSGKTACYCLPILQGLSEDPFGVHSLVMLPSRELALQVADQFGAFGAPMGIRCVVLIGGCDVMKSSTDLLKRPHVVIATPGRLAALLDDGECRAVFKHLKVLVLDEADRILQESFAPDMLQILSCLPRAASGRQTLLFSATLSNDIKVLMDTYKDTHGKSIEFIDTVQEAPDTVSTLEQVYVFIPSRVKTAYLYYILTKVEQFTGEKSQGIIFAGTCRAAQLVTTTLERLGESVSPLHSLLNQRRRVASLAKFRSSMCRILVATDVASRGLDIPVCSFVVNLDMPVDPDDYTHRVGRTARAGRKGIVVSLVTENDVKKVHQIEKHVKARLSLLPVDDRAVLKELSLVTKAQQWASSVLSESGFNEQLERFKEGKMKRRAEGVDALASVKQRTH